MEATVERMTSKELPNAEVRSRVLRWLIWLAYVSGWTAALLTPQPVHLAKHVLPEESLFASFKLAHVFCYAIMTILSGWLPVRAGGRWLLLSFLSSHALLTEFFQRFVPGRTSSLFDVAVDHLGILLGLLLTRKWWRPN